MFKLGEVTVHAVLACCGWAASFIFTSAGHKLHFPTIKPSQRHPDATALRTRKAKFGVEEWFINEGAGRWDLDGHHEQVEIISLVRQPLMLVVSGLWIQPQYSIPII